MTNNRILFLALNTFRSTGGIEEVCRSFCRILMDINAIFKVYVLNDEQPDERFIDKNMFKGFNCNKFIFGYKALMEGTKCGIVVLSHINLLSIAWIIKLISPKTRIILYAHGIEVWRKLSPWKVRFLQKNTEIWAVSNYTASILHKRHKVPPHKIAVLNNCLGPFFHSPDRSEKPPGLLRRYGIRKDQPVLFTLTRMSDSEKYKGYDIVISILPELIKKIPGMQYIIGGKADDKERRRIVKMVKKLNLENNVFLTGFVAEEELFDHFSMADCFIMPSKKEGFGIVFIEALACGSRVIAGNKDGSTDALLNGELGILVDPDNGAEISNAILASLSDGHCPVSAKKLQEKCIAHFGYQQYKLKVNDLLFTTNSSETDSKTYIQ